MTLIEKYNLPQLAPDINPQNIRAWEVRLRSVLQSLFTTSRRTFLLIDGLNELTDEVSQTDELDDIIGSRYAKHMVEFLQEVLEQDFGNVSIAVFSRPLKLLEPLVQFADVSIRLTQLEPDLTEYTHLRVGQKVKSALVEADLNHDQDSLAAIEQVMREASAGL